MRLLFASPACYMPNSFYGFRGYNNFMLRFTKSILTKLPIYGIIFEMSLMAGNLHIDFRRINLPGRIKSSREDNALAEPFTREETKWQ